MSACPIHTSLNHGCIHCLNHDIARLRAESERLQAEKERVHRELRHEQFENMRLRDELTKLRGPVDFVLTDVGGVTVMTRKP